MNNITKTIKWETEAVAEKIFDVNNEGDEWNVETITEILSQSNKALLESVRESIEDWFTQNPKYRTKKNLLKEIDQALLKVNLK